MAELISFVALVVSVVALWTSYFHRRQDRNAELARLTADLRSMLRTIEPRPQRTRDTWHALLAARGNFHSGARLEIDQELDRFSAQIAEIADWASKLPRLPDIGRRSVVEHKIVEVIEAREKLSAIASDLDGRDEKAAALGAEMRARAGV